MSRYVVGIDLGTTNNSLAFALAAGGEGEADPRAPSPPIEPLPVPQVVGLNDVSPRPLLPSFLYLAGAKEFPAGALDLPWKSAPDQAVGVIEQAESLGAGVTLHPLLGGMSPKLGFQSLELFLDKVLPRIRKPEAGAPAARATA